MIECSPSWQGLIIIKAKEENFMSTLTKEQIKQLVRENNFQSVSDINEYINFRRKQLIALP